MDVVWGPRPENEQGLGGVPKALARGENVTYSRRHHEVTRPHRSPSRPRLCRGRL